MWYISYQRTETSRYDSVQYAQEGVMGRRKLPSKEDRAWSAAAIDGEGCITSQSCSRTNRRNLLVSVANTNLDFLNKLSGLWGGSVAKHGKPAKPTHRQCYYWRLTGQGASAALKAILPYLIIKREQAELGILLARTVRTHGTDWLSPQVLAERERLAGEIHNLNSP